MSVPLFLLIWILLLGMNCPVFLALTISSTFYMVAGGEILVMIPQRLTSAADSFPLLAAPFFIFTGNLMNASGITDRVFTFADTLTGRIRGGMGHANILGSLIFSGMSGAAVADAGGLGAVEMK
ncbi:MAG: TRAP transporter large permease subunit, partial [Nitrospinota bacterium]